MGLGKGFIPLGGSYKNGVVDSHSKLSLHSWEAGKTLWKKQVESGNRVRFGGAQLQGHF